MKFYITSTIMLAIILVISISLALSKDTKTTSPMSKAAVSSISSKMDIFSKAAVSSTASSMQPASAIVVITAPKAPVAPVQETPKPEQVQETPKPAAKPAQVEVKQPEPAPQAAPAPAETKQTYYNGESEEYKPIVVTPAATKKGFSFI